MACAPSRHQHPRRSDVPGVGEDERISGAVHLSERGHAGGSVAGSMRGRAWRARPRGRPLSNAAPLAGAGPRASHRPMGHVVCVPAFRPPADTSAGPGARVSVPAPRRTSRRGPDDTAHNAPAQFHDPLGRALRAARPAERPALPLRTHRLRPRASGQRAQRHPVRRAVPAAASRLRRGRVTYVRNFTDIDDKIIARAEETGRIDPRSPTRRWRGILDDMAALGSLAPTHMPRATGYIAEMVEMIEGLVARATPTWPRVTRSSRCRPSTATASFRAARWRT